MRTNMDDHGLTAVSPSPPCNETGQAQTPLACAVIAESQEYALVRSGLLDVWPVGHHALALDPRPHGQD